MIHHSSHRAHFPSVVPKFSDPDIVKAILKSDFWRHVFLGERKALWLVFKAVIGFKIEMFSYPLRAVLRYHHGRRTTGCIIMLSAVVMMIAFNTHHILGGCATFFPLAVPALPFFMTDETCMRAVFIDIHSYALLWFWIGSFCLSLLHWIIAYKNKDQRIVSDSRGTSWIYTLMGQYVHLPDPFVRRVIEPLGAAALGYGLWHLDIDPVFGVFLILAGLSLFVQELYDAVWQFSMRE